MNTYIFFFSGKQVVIKADSLYSAKLQAVAIFKPSKSKAHMVHGALAEQDGVPVIHTAID